MVKTIKEFCSDAGGWGLLSVVAAAVFFGIAIWEHLHDRSLSAFVFLCCTVPLFWIGSLIAWQKERQRYKSELGLNSKPEFEGNVEVLYPADCSPRLEVSGGTLGKQKRIFTHRFVVRLTLVNVSPSPSSVRTLQLVISAEGGGLIATLDPIAPVEKGFRLLVLTPPLGQPYLHDDLPYLMDMIHGNTFSQGIHVTGWLGFQLSQCVLPAGQLRYDLKLIDGYGNSHEMSFDKTTFQDAAYDSSQRI